MAVRTCFRIDPEPFACSQAPQRCVTDFILSGAAMRPLHLRSCSIVREVSVAHFGTCAIYAFQKHFLRCELPFRVCRTPLSYPLTYRMGVLLAGFTSYGSLNDAASSLWPWACLAPSCASFQAPHAWRIRFYAQARHFDRDAFDCMNRTCRMCAPDGVSWVSVPYICYISVNFRVLLTPLMLGDALSHWEGSGCSVGAVTFTFNRFRLKSQMCQASCASS